MKKSLVVATVALISVFTLSSASVYARGLTGAGVKAGLNLAITYGDDFKPFMAYSALTEGGYTDAEATEMAYNIDVSTKIRTAAALGAFIEFNINNYLTVQPELLYTMKGVKAKGEGVVYWCDYDKCYYDYANIEKTIKISYLEIPLLGKLSIPMQGKVKPFLLIGSALAFKLSTKIEGKTGDASGTDDVSDYINSIDFGLIFGAGADIKLKSGKITFDGRYNLGLINVLDVPGEDFEAKNPVISIMVGYSFPL